MTQKRDLSKRQIIKSPDQRLVVLSRFYTVLADSEAIADGLIP
jgi:hypothetical protein